MTLSGIVEKKITFLPDCTSYTRVLKKRDAIFGFQKKKKKGKKNKQTMVAHKSKTKGTITLHHDDSFTQWKGNPRL